MREALELTSTFFGAIGIILICDAIFLYVSRNEKGWELGLFVSAVMLGVVLILGGYRIWKKVQGV